MVLREQLLPGMMLAAGRHFPGRSTHLLPAHSLYRQGKDLSSPRLERRCHRSVQNHRLLDKPRYPDNLAEVVYPFSVDRTGFEPVTKEL